MATPNALPVPGKTNNAPKGDAGSGHPVEDLATAIIFMVVGVGAFIIALDYRTGTMHRMGPGIFPMLVSVLMAAIGAILAVQALVAWKLHRMQADTPALLPNFATVRALTFVMLALLSFAMLVRPAGLFLATYALVFIATRAEPGRGVVGALILSLALAIACSGIFVYAIGLPIPLWPE